jgi:hypothetical protein
MSAAFATSPLGRNRQISPILVTETKTQDPTNPEIPSGVQSRTAEPTKFILEEGNADMDAI